MKIEATIGPNGKIERKIDFEGAKLPNGRSVDEILKENDDLNREINNLKKEVKYNSSILNKIIPNRKARTVVEIILLIMSSIGFIQLIAIFA